MHHIVKSFNQLKLVKLFLLLTLINEAYRVDNFHNEDYSRERYIIRDENEKIKEIGFILNNQKIGECNFYNSQGLKYLTENWIHNSKGKAILYSSIKFNTLNNEI